MEWLSDIGALLGNVATGGLFGLLGSIVGVGAKWLQEKQRQAWEREKHTMEMDTIRLQMEQGAQETEHELALVGQQGAWDGLGRSIGADAITGSQASRWVNDIRALFRPILTAGLVVLAYLIFRDLLAALGSGNSILGAILTSAEVAELLRYIVNSLVFAASTAVVWWFGDRAFSPPGQKGR